MINVVKLNKEEVLSLQSVKNLINNIYEVNEFMTFDGDLEALKWYNDRFGDYNLINITNKGAEVELYVAKSKTVFEQEAEAVKTLNKYINHLWADMEE